MLFLSNRVDRIRSIYIYIYTHRKHFLDHKNIRYLPPFLLFEFCPRNRNLVSTIFKPLTVKRSFDRRALELTLSLVFLFIKYSRALRSMFSVRFTACQTHVTSQASRRSLGCSLVTRPIT